MALVPPLQVSPLPLHFRTENVRICLTSWGRIALSSHHRVRLSSLGAVILLPGKPCVPDVSLTPPSFTQPAPTCATPFETRSRVRDSCLGGLMATRETQKSAAKKGRLPRLPGNGALWPAVFLCSHSNCKCVLCPPVPGTVQTRNGPRCTFNTNSTDAWKEKDRLLIHETRRDVTVSADS